MITTPEQMREAAAQIAKSYDFSVMSSTHADIRADQIATAICAIPIAPQPVAVTVKPLVWVKSVRNGFSECCHTEPLEYIIRGPFPDGHYIWMRLNGKGLGVVSTATLELAKAAAQADYEARILSALTIHPADPRHELAVWYGKMPESNGKENWTASLYRKTGDAHMDGFCFARSEYADRVRYEADRVRWIIGDLAEKPHILDYDADLHSGYIPPAADLLSDPRVVALVEAARNMRDYGTCLAEQKYHRDLAAAIRARGQK